MANRWVHKAIYLIGEKIRNPHLRGYYKDLIDSDFFSVDKLEKLQLSKLKLLLRKAYDKCPYYKEMLDRCGISDGIINNLSELSKIPVSEKSVIISNCNNIQTDGGTIKAETSGSTGESLSFKKSEEWDSANRAAQYRGYSWYGVNPWDKNGYMWGYNLERKKAIKTRFLDALLNRTRIFSYDENIIAEFLHKIKNAEYIEGYSSLIYETAKKINEYGMEKINVKMVKGTSEKIFASYQDDVKRAFGKKMISEYGSAEAGIIAFECPCGNMHIAMENVIVEEIDGECVVTNLNSDTFPFIRYKLGDYIELDKETQCRCGRKSYIIKNVLGRVGSKVIGYKMEYPSLTLYYIFKDFVLKTGRLLSYQFVQREPGKIELVIEQKISDVDKAALEEIGKKYWHDDIKVIVKDEAEMIRDGAKKKDFVSYI